MFGGEQPGYISTDQDETSEKYNAAVDKKVKEILDSSSVRVTKMIKAKERELRDLAKNLFHYDYLNEEEIEKVIKGQGLVKEKVREWTNKEQYLIKF